MTRQEFRELAESGVVVLDGATGSNLQKKGMAAGVCPEEWILAHPEVLIDLQKAYLHAGSNILYTPTFSGNRKKLEEYGLENRLFEINHKLVNLSKLAVKEAGAEGKAWVAGDITMTGEQLAPIGTLDFEELVEIYKEQVRALEGVDLIAVETMMSLQECRAAVLAVKETCDLPVMVTLTFREDGRTLYGTDAATAAVVLEHLGVDAVGVNCSVGPDKMKTLVETMKAYTQIPVVVKPNAGLPKLVDGITEYDMSPEAFADGMLELVKAGADIIGGCCGTTPEHIKAMVEKIAAHPRKLNYIEKKQEKRRILTTETKTLEIPLDGRFMVIGERINPTGKKALQAQLLEGKLGMVRQMAEQQRDQGADILDVNLGMNGIDEKEMMLAAVQEITRMVNLPLCIDSSRIDVIEAVLRRYAGRALINSISLEKEKIEKLLPIAKKYGAMFILLPLSDRGLPKTMEEKKEIILKILDKAYALGMTKEDVIVDGLVATVGANQNAALETMETIRYCRQELGIATVCGLSNISFGLPERMCINSAFLTLAMEAGLTMAIANPSQELLMNAACAADLLLAKKGADLRYIQRAAQHPVSVVKDITKKEEMTVQDRGRVFTKVVKGEKEAVLEEVKQSLSEGNAPSKILHDMLIPAIHHVGELFEKNVYFLPQLISSAETMEMAVHYLEPMLSSGQEHDSLGTIVMATVEGDIHDIGKNLVVLMLKNYGYRVIDLGKDVPADKIIQTAKEEDADIIGLSALMTTTMMEMKNVLARVRASGLRAKVILGGAVVTQGFADEIGADGYSKDAGEAVKLVQRLLG